MRNLSPYDVKYETATGKVEHVQIDADRIEGGDGHLRFYCGAEFVFCVRECDILIIENKEKEYVKRNKAYTTHDCLGWFSRFWRKYFLSE